MEQDKLDDVEIIMISNDWEYRLYLKECGITCPVCDGQGGSGRSVGGVTLSYHTCGECDGYGLVPPQDSEDKNISIRCITNRHYTV